MVHFLTRPTLNLQPAFLCAYICAKDIVEISVKQIYENFDLIEITE